MLTTESNLPPRWLPVAAALLLAALIPFLPFLSLPGISDDYQQIGLARDFIHPDGLVQLAGDALYRCRATSLFWTRAIDAAVGPDIFTHRLGSVLLHALNGALIVLFGSIPAIGYRRAVLAAVAFLLMNGHQEAIVWVAAVHDLIVFGFSMGALLCWVHWLNSRRHGWLLAVYLLFVLALYSKESAAVLPAVLLAAWWVAGLRRRADLTHVALMLVVSGIYTLMVFQAARNHLHLNDGTFSLHAPFWLTLPRTLFRITAPWAIIAGLVLAAKREYRVLATILCFCVLTLLPYSFLVYNVEAPSRHRYWSTAGAALLLAWAIDHLWRSRSRRQLTFAILLAVTFAVSSPLYLWQKKLPQYERRAAPTETFLEFAKGKTPPVWVEQAPYHAEIYRFTARVMLGWKHSDVRAVDEEAPPPDALIFRDPFMP